MNSLTISSFLVAVFLASAFNLCIPGNNTLSGMEEQEPGLYPRIYGGKESERNEFPYQAGLEFHTGSVSFWCGGALIDKEWVLTAAHCASGAQSVTVQLGMRKLLFPMAEYKVDKSKIIPNGDYDAKTIRGDIALIHIPPVTFTSSIQPIGLPRNVRPFPSYVGTTAMASGWGFTSNTATFKPSYLQYGILKVISNSDCEKLYRKGEIYPGKICTGNSGSEICKGDSGGPLVSTATDALIGITSFGSIRGCGKGLAAGFTRVDFYMDWIKKITKLPI